ncbi:MAG: putative endonuclease 4 [Candidatus Moranbacteria bacterium GW2011_GWE1_35_17]|nr:MAG: putative endonuclease 4 [Candidatus Moranbacteria bacterium GW2011_GWE2_35_164]KKP68004.1 MAG: putative endonuclease 4 [Candidatus Moranbacteria bacterium GW2011_GWE1_35_17]KKP82296.1 MAG: putative endonuclease 4 [Candidatus Moranbacteria bacterium GW2011_GWF1_35_5]KKP82444.1 MAG: putative endonuclease 4 [Candidatus Moranbacteria bacterium GW2011_GWF2_35_54]
MKIGCHVSIAGGVFNAPERAHALGCEVMQIFSRSPQGGKSPELTLKSIQEFKILNFKFQIKETYVHSPYYINFASADNRIRYGSVHAIQEELERASLLGAKYVMTHLGSAKDLGEKEGRDKTIEMLIKTLENYKGSTKLLLENSAGAGAIIGDDLSELAYIIKKVKSKNIAGICLDTQHSFASGYDWRDFKKTIARIDKEIGIKNIKLIHANDSLTECGSNRDRHAHIGQGLIGHEAFKNIVAFAKENKIDMILETEHDGEAEDIKLLKSLRGK